VRPRGFVFDLDGTLVDNMSIHAEAFFAFIERHGLPRLGVPAEGCLAFEDAPLGVTAARQAGMGVVGVTTSFAPQAFADHGAPADLYIGDFADYLAGPGRWLLA
jgi:beta-phosphoglucomutase-like phosphatase (HAD superfamily)